MSVYRLYLCFGFIFGLVSVSAQQHNIWYFGDKAGLDFSTDEPTPLLNSEMITPEACASVADENGQLLFYSNGNNVWNKNHSLMLNGTGLYGNSSSSQMLVIPMPGNENHYYVFAIDHLGGEKGLTYSVVDMTADGGLGEVIIKNVPLVTPVCEKVTAGWHSNGIDIWVITYLWNSDAVYAYKVTPDGIELPVITNTGFFIGSNQVWHTQGYMKVSQQGNLIAIASSQETLLFEFNRSSGELSNPVILNTNEGTYGVEFSPSGNFLYTSEYSGIVQYNLLAEDISASATTVSPVAGGALQLAPNQKIYIANIFNMLSVINNPELEGADCNPEINSVDIGFRQAWNGLPYFLPPRTQTHNIEVENLCFGDTTLFSFTSTIENPENVLWDFGDGNFSNEITPQYTYTQSGTYLITLTVEWQETEYVTHKTITVFPIPTAHTPPDMILCENENTIFDLLQQNSLILGTQPSELYSITYHLTLSDAEAGSDAIATSYENTSNPQTIFARITNTTAGCYGVTSFQIKVIPQFTVEMESHYYLCDNNPVTINVPDGFSSYQWSTGDTSQSITVHQPGNYILTVFQGNCRVEKEITVTELPTPVIDYITINDWNNYTNSITIFMLQQSNYEYSIDGIIFQNENTFNNLPTGFYKVYVKNACGIASKEIAVLAYPKYFTPNGDGIHDFWRIPFGTFEPEMKISIFDRYGRLIKVFYGNDTGWDGTYKGKLLPSTDYWFSVVRKDGRIHKGHFSLKR